MNIRIKTEELVQFCLVLDEYIEFKLPENSEETLIGTIVLSEESSNTKDFNGLILRYFLFDKKPKYISLFDIKIIKKISLFD